MRGFIETLYVQIVGRLYRVPTWKGKVRENNRPYLALLVITNYKSVLGCRA